METIGNIAIYCIKTAYTILPSVGANVAPILMKDIPFLKYPMDFNKSIGGERILGDHKTFRGLFFGILFAIILVTIQYFIRLFFNTNWLLYEPYFNDNYIRYLLIGAGMGFGAILGDSVKSFFKRRLNIKPGKPFIPWDQIDCALGGLLVGRIFWAYEIEFAITTILITFCLHIIIRHIAALLGLCDKW